MFDANSEENDLVRFDWKSIRGTWLEQQACDAMNYLQIVVTTCSFGSLKAIFYLKSVDISYQILIIMTETLYIRIEWVFYTKSPNSYILFNPVRKKESDLKAL